MQKMVCISFLAVVAFLLLTPPLLPAQEIPFDFEEDMLWVPEPEKASGLKELGYLDTGDPDLVISYPEALQVHNNQIYIFDVQLEKLLRFNSDGSFDASLLENQQRISNHIRFLSVASPTSILFGDHTDLYLFIDGKLQHIPNYYRSNDVIWDGTCIYAVRGRNFREEHPLIYQMDAEGNLIEAWGEPYNPEVREKTMFSRYCLANNNGNLFLSDTLSNGFSIIQLSEQSIHNVELKAPALQKRILQTVRSSEYVQEHDLRRWKIFPTFDDMAVTDTAVFFLMNVPGSVSIVQCSLDGTIEHTWNMESHENRWYHKLAVADTGGKTIFFLAGAERDGTGRNGRVWRFAPGGTPVDVQAAFARNQKMKDDAALSEQAKEIQARRKQYEEVNKILQKMRAATDSDEKFRLALEHFRDTDAPEVSINILLSLLREPWSPEFASAIKPILKQAMPSLEQDYAQDYFKVFIALCHIALDEKDDLDAHLQSYLSGEPELSSIAIIINALDTAAWWQQMVDMCDEFLERCTVEGVVNDIGGISRERAQVFVKARNGDVMAKKAAALLELNELARVAAVCRQAEEITITTYIGTPMTDYRLSWARALEKLGNQSEALQVLLKDAVFSADKEKMAVLERLHAAVGVEEPFADFVRNNRLRLAKKIDNATFYNMDGKPVSVNEKLGKATLLTFWMPST